MKSILKLTTYFFIGGIAFISCKKGQEHFVANTPPVANAGPDQKVFLPSDSVELKGSGADADGTVVSYQWTKSSGPLPYMFVNSNNAVTSVKNLAEGVYEFELTIADNAGLIAKDKVFVFVVDPANDPCYGCWDY